jgi:hypothetical protein
MVMALPDTVVFGAVATRNDGAEVDIILSFTSEASSKPREVEPRLCRFEEGFSVVVVCRAGIAE